MYVAWERLLRRLLVEPRVPRELVDEFVIRLNDMLVPALTAPSRIWFDGDTADIIKARDQLLLRALTAAVDEVAARRGSAGGAGSPGHLHTVVFAHPLGISEATRRFTVGPFERPGYAETLMSISGRLPDSGIGSSFSAIFDVGDWDRSIATNAPGQSESPESPHFADLARLWAAGEYFPLSFTGTAVSANTKSTLTLTPKGSER
jgi:penicillin amidase